MSIQTGDTVTIRRGKLAGTTGTVTDVNETEAALKLADGGFSIQKLSNVKAPDVPTINADDLAAELKTAFENATLEDTSTEDVLLALLSRLERKLPGLESRLPGRDNN